MYGEKTSKHSKFAKRIELHYIALNLFNLHCIDGSLAGGPGVASYNEIPHSILFLKEIVQNPLNWAE